jgi:hypothetical protein
MPRLFSSPAIAFIDVLAQLLSRSRGHARARNERNRRDDGRLMIAKCRL